MGSGDALGVTRRSVIQVTGAAFALPVDPFSTITLENRRMAFTPKFVDLVRNTTTTTGTGNFALGPAVNGFTGFSQALQTGDSFYYSCLGVDKPAEREVGRGTLLAGGSISRDPISGTKTNFTSGTKTIALIAAAEWFAGMQAGGAGGTAPAIAVTRDEVAAMTDQQKPVVMCERGREGIFAWDGSNLSAQVAADPRQAINIAPASAPSGASGAWVRRFTGPKSATWFGAIGDGATDNAAALQAWLDSGGHLYLPAGEYFSSAKLKLRRFASIDGAAYGFDSRTVDFGQFNFGDDNQPGSRIRFPISAGASTGAFEVQPQTTLTTVAAVTAAGSGAFSQEGAMRSCIRNIALIGPGLTAGGTASTGFYTRTVVHLDGVHVYDFTGKGFDVSASADADDGNSEYGAADLSTFRNCRASSNGSHGFHVRGREANVLHFDACDAINNGGWGFINEAISNSLYSNCHAASNALGSYKATSLVAAHTFVDCYTEGGSLEHCSLGGAPSGQCVVVGGNLAYVAINNNDLANVPNTVAPQQFQGNYFRSSGQSSLGGTLANGQAAFHGHFNYGAVVQGSVSAGNYDVSLFNKAGTFVAGVVTGQPVFRVAGQHQLLNGNIFFNDVGAAFPGFGGPGNAYLMASSAGGLELYGRGASYDIRLNNQAGSSALRVPANTTNVEVVGTIAASNLSGTNSGDQFTNTTAARLVGRGSAAGAGPAQELTLAGGLSISGTALTAAGPLTPTSVASSGAVTSSGGGVGYATGAGGTVIQATSKSTAVTLNKASGQVTTHNASMAAAAAVSFVVNNSQVAATDTINLNLASGNATAGTYRYWVEAIASGSFKIVVENRSGGALAEALTFNFAVLKAVNA
jgi:hypothetical protein